jgi:hypothetical protein
VGTAYDERKETRSSFVAVHRRSASALGMFLVCQPRNRLEFAVARLSSAGYRRIRNDSEIDVGSSEYGTLEYRPGQSLFSATVSCTHVCVTYKVYHVQFHKRDSRSIRHHWAIQL